MNDVLRKLEIFKEIRLYKAKLYNLDYMDIKNSNALARGVELPYDPVEIDALKQPYRDKINALRAELEARRNDDIQRH
jgi:hypothetical protein